jgi:hypothetical protein
MCRATAAVVEEERNKTAASKSMSDDVLDKRARTEEKNQFQDGNVVRGRYRSTAGRAEYCVRANVLV